MVSSQGIMLEGVTSGSQNNCFWIKQLDVLLDIGICSRALISMNQLLLTHVHTDHSAGLVYYLSQRKLFPLPKCSVYVHQEIKENLLKIIQIWEQLEDMQYNYDLIGVQPDTKYPLTRNAFFTAHPVKHRVPALGYTIFETKQKLKPEYQSLSNQEIIALKKQNIPICDALETPILTYLGDCDFSSFTENSLFQKSEYLIMECTYLDQWKDISHAQRWGHIHLDQIIANIALFQNIYRIILTHFSSRYSAEYIQKNIMNKCPPELLQKIVIWPMHQEADCHQLPLS